MPYVRDSEGRCVVTDMSSGLMASDGMLPGDKVPVSLFTRIKRILKEVETSNRWVRQGSRRRRQRRRSNRTSRKQSRGDQNVSLNSYRSERIDFHMNGCKVDKNGRKLSICVQLIFCEIQRWWRKICSPSEFSL